LFNGIFTGQRLTILSNDYWTDGSTGLSGFSVSNSPISIVGGAAGEKPTFFYTPNWEANFLNAKPHLIDTIGGMDPLEWVTEVASTHSILHAGMKVCVDILRIGKMLWSGLVLGQHWPVIDNEKSYNFTAKR